MAYKKPEIVAKSESKQTLAAGCPTKKPYAYCTLLNGNCMCGSLK